MSAEAVPAYPATFTFDPPESIARWRVIGNIILAIPHLIIAYVLNIVAEVLAFVAWILGVFTGKVPEGILGVIAMYLRYSTRASVYASFLKEEYPPFTFATTLADPGDDPRVRVDFGSETEGRNRLTIFFRILLAIPHIIVIMLISIVAFFVVRHRVVRGAVHRQVADRAAQLRHRPDPLEPAPQRVHVPADRRVPAVQLRVANARTPRSAWRVGAFCVWIS